MSDVNPLPFVHQIDDDVLQRLPTAMPLRLPDGNDNTRVDLQVVDVGDDRHVLAMQELEGYGERPWLLGTHVQLDIAAPQLARLDTLFQMGIAAGAIVMLVTAGLGMGLSRPIGRLAQAAGHVCDLDFANVPRMNGGWFRELREAADSFNAMLDALRRFKIYVPRQLVLHLMRHRSPLALTSEERSPGPLVLGLGPKLSLSRQPPPSRSH